MATIYATIYFSRQALHFQRTSAGAHRADKLHVVRHPTELLGHQSKGPRSAILCNLTLCARCRRALIPSQWQTALLGPLGNKMVSILARISKWKVILASPVGVSFQCETSHYTADGIARPQGRTRGTAAAFGSTGPSPKASGRP